MAAKNVIIIVTCVIFLIYFSNVVAGATGIGVFLSDVMEMLTLFVACGVFVVGMLAHERAAMSKNAGPANDDT